ncbi:MAG: UvrB/UvrC motif-containing protein [Planctomycetes bacterium]|nr:UvrB/UvrC motif-containing protein [Planctomycetota bacterium]
MNHCTSCQKAVATIHILDMKDGNIAGEQHLCAACAEKGGVVQSKTHALQWSVQALEDYLSGGKQAGESGRRALKEGQTCPGCGLSAADFKMRGRLGCPRCYETFRPALIPLLERVHDATSHRGRYPGRGAIPTADQDTLAALQRRLAAAIAAENYEEAASLRDQLRRVGEPKSQAEDRS